ncbi:MAG: YqaE/Pmp3 family membrane protein [Bacteroidetes bacterium]|nr:YqaE/Pmp3 family membrane protein [Bacteroidota bacterium]
MILLAIFFPCLSFFFRGSIGKGIVCLILQITLIGWLPAVIWAVMDLNSSRADKRTQRIVDSMSSNR